MDRHVDVYLHHGDKWVTEPELKYLEGDVHIGEDFDIVFLSIITVKDVYKKNWVIKMLSMCMC